MRYQEFNLTEDELFELKMSPTNLNKMAKDIDARVGMEFELIVPGVEGDEEEYESEPDYDADERFPTGPGWHRDVIAFFRGGSMGNSTRSIQRAIDELNENFWDWVGEQEEEFINSNEGQDRATEIAGDNVDRSDYETEEEYIEALANWIDENGDQIRDQLLDDFRSDLDSKFEEWLDDNGIGTMSDFANEHSLDWPYWTEPEYYGGSGVSIDAVADDFSQAIGRPVNASSSYHGATRQPGKYVVEPDSSLEGDEPGDTGLEFVSPPLTIDEMLSDIDKVAKWAGRAGAYTNESTGLHMNVSVPDQKNLDFVKLAMFLGDNYILEQFGREGNSYCKSILKQIITTARSEPGRVEEMMRQFQGGLNQLASKVLHTGSTGKYSSINNRGDWVEFRSPGGDWLDEDLSKVKNTMLRTVVALDVATKPAEFKQEYYKKLYKTLTQGKEDDSIQYFAKYAAGELPRAALKSFIKQIQTQQEVKKQKPGEQKLYWWNVAVDGQRIEVVAASREEAWQKATDERQEWMRFNINQADIRALRPYQEQPATPSRDQRFAGYWEIVDRNTDQIVHFFNANSMDDPRSVAEAERIAAAWQQQTGFDDPYYVRPLMRANDTATPDTTQPVAGSTNDLARQRLAAQMPRLELEDGNWEVYSIAGNNSVYRFAANTEEEAVRAFDIWQDAIRHPGMDRQGFNLRAVQRTSARGSESLPPGNTRWLVLDSNDREVYSFVHRNNQAEANQYAINWLRGNNMVGQGEFMVVPAR